MVVMIWAAEVMTNNDVINYESSYVMDINTPDKSSKRLPLQIFIYLFFVYIYIILYILYITPSMTSSLRNQCITQYSLVIIT